MLSFGDSHGRAYNSKALVLTGPDMPDSQQYQCAWALPKGTCAFPRDSTASRRRDVVHAKRWWCTTTRPCTFLSFLRLHAAIRVWVQVHTVDISRRNIIFIYVHLISSPSSRRVLVARPIAHGYDLFGPLPSGSFSFILLRVTRPRGHQPPRRASSTCCCPLLATRPSRPFEDPGIQWSLSRDALPILHGSLAGSPWPLNDLSALEDKMMHKTGKRRAVVMQASRLVVRECGWSMIR